MSDDPEDPENKDPVVKAIEEALLERLFEGLSDEQIEYLTPKPLPSKTHGQRSTASPAESVNGVNRMHQAPTGSYHTAQSAGCQMIPGLEKAIIGTCLSPGSYEVLAYDYNVCIDMISTQYDWDEDRAKEWLSATVSAMSTMMPRPAFLFIDDGALREQLTSKYH